MSVNKFTKDLILLFDEMIFYMVTQVLLIDLFEIAIDIAGKTWNQAEEVLFRYAEDKDRTWGLRFYILITECFKEWGMYLRPTNKDNSDSIFKRMYNDLTAKIPLCPIDLYYYTDIEKLAEKDAEFNRWKNNISSKPSNVFHQGFETFKEKENSSHMSNVTNHHNEVKNNLLSKNSVDRRMRSREELSNLVESLKHIDDSKNKLANAQANFTKIFEQIKLDRKLLMHEIFRNKIILEKIKQARLKYQDSVILNYDKVEDFLKMTDRGIKELQDIVLKELEFANWLFDYLDSVFNLDPKNRYQELRTEICKTFQRIYGVYPRYYDQFLNKPSTIYQTNYDFEKSGNKQTDAKYSNRDHSIQVRGYNDSFMNNDTSLGRVINITYSFSKDVNDVTGKMSPYTNKDTIDEYGQNYNPNNMNSLNRGVTNVNVKTFLKNAVEQEKAMIRSSNNQNKLVKDPGPYDEFLLNLKKVPVKLTSTFKEYEETSEQKRDVSINESRIRDMVKTFSRRNSRDSKLNDSKGSIKINFDKMKSKPSIGYIDNSKENRNINYRDEYGRDSSNKKLTSNAKHINTSFQRPVSLDITNYSIDDNLGSLKKKNPGLLSSFLNKNASNMQNDSLLIEKKMTSLEQERRELQARKQRLEKEVSELSIRERSISETPNESVNRTKRTLRTITDYGNVNKTVSNKQVNNGVALNCLIDEFNKKNEIYSSLKSRYNELNKKYEEKVRDSYYLNLKQSDRMRDTVMSDCMALIGNSGTRSTSLGVRNIDSTRYIDFDIN